MSVADSLSGKRILLTGATGFVGKVFLAFLLERLPGVQILLAVRTRGRVERPLIRVERMVATSPAFRPLRARHGDHLGPWLASRLDAVASDVEKPLFGWTEDDLAARSGIDLVVHCAGLTDFAPDPLRALAANTLGAHHASQLAQRLGAHLVHVSTAFAVGMADGLVSEQLDVGVSPLGLRFDPIEEVRAAFAACRESDVAQDVDGRVSRITERAKRLGWANVYTYTKGLAEHLIGARGRVTIVRPSIVECARAVPFAGWNEGLNTSGPLAWLISTAFRDLPADPDAPFDVVPVDDVAIGLVLACAAALGPQPPALLHLASGDVRPLTLGRTIELTGLAMRRWARDHGNRWDRLLFAHLDPVAVPAEAPGPFAAARVARFARWASEQLGEGSWREAALTTADQAERVDRMLALYRPFIHDHRWVFRTDTVRALSALEPDPDFRWTVGDIDWRRYWIDVEYPGLRRWCIPLVWGGTIEKDEATSPPLRIAAGAPASAVAK